MDTIQCNDAFGYGCTNSIEEDRKSELFYFKQTHSGDYFQRTCKECVKRNHREKYNNGTHRRKNGNDCSISETEGDETSEGSCGYLT